MPIKIQGDLPVKEILEKENIFVMDESRASHQDIRPKALFYNAAESRQVDTLADLLSPVRFAEICGQPKTAAEFWPHAVPEDALKFLHNSSFSSWKF